MKKTWKSIAVVMAVLLMMSVVLTACGGGGGGGNADDPIVGNWTVTKMNVGGMEIDLDSFIEQYGEIAGMTAKDVEFKFDIKADGTFVGSARGETANGTWEKNDDAYTLTIDGDPQEVTLENGEMTMELGGMTMVLTK